MKLEREEIIFGAYWLILFAVMVTHVVRQPDPQPVEVRTKPPVARNDTNDATPLGPMDIPGAASWSGDEPGKDGREQ